MSNLHGVKKGDYIFSIIKGWERVLEIRIHEPYQIKTTGGTYTFNGRYREHDSYPIIFKDVPEWFSFPVEERPCTFKKDEIVVVRDNDCDSWKLAYFKVFNKQDDPQFPFRVVLLDVDPKEVSGFRFCERLSKVIQK